MLSIGSILEAICRLEKKLDLVLARLDVLHGVLQEVLDSEGLDDEDLEDEIPSALRG